MDQLRLQLLASPAFVLVFCWIIVGNRRGGWDRSEQAVGRSGLRSGPRTPDIACVPLHRSMFVMRGKFSWEGRRGELGKC